MIELAQFKRLTTRRLTSLLGLSLDGSKLEGVAVRRTNGSLDVAQTLSVSLSLDPLTADFELVGREIRNHLDAAGIRERQCVLGLPLKWALTAHVDIPDLSEEDIASFLQIEAERGFPCDVQTLSIATSRCRSSSGARQAMLVGIPRNQLQTLDKVLRAAKLKPVSFSLGITALQPAAAEVSVGVLALAIGETHVALQVTSGGGIVALRTLEGALELEGGRRLLHPDLVAREARITLGQLPAELRESVKHIRIFGPRDLSQQLADELELRLESMGLKIEIVNRYGDKEFPFKLPNDTSVTPAMSLAAARLAGRQSAFEFLPPRVTAFQQMTSRYSSGPLRTAGAVGAGCLLVVLGLFLFQQWQLSKWRAQWVAIAPKVKELQKVTEQIHQFRPWYDDSMRALVILRQLTMAFPEEGSVSAKTVEIRELNSVTCTGVAKDNKELLKTLEKLRLAGATDLKVIQMRGKAPMQFTFDYRWSGSGKNEN